MNKVETSIVRNLDLYSIYLCFIMLPQKTTKNILRDCLKLVPNMVKEEQKVLAVRKLVIQEFRKNKDLTDAD